MKVGNKGGQQCLNMSEDGQHGGQQRASNALNMSKEGQPTRTMMVGDNSGRQQWTTMVGNNGGVGEEGPHPC